MAAVLGLQVAAFAWFALSTPRKPVSAMEGLAKRLLMSGRTQAAVVPVPLALALPVWSGYSRIAQRHAVGWRLAAAVSALLCFGLATALWKTIEGPSVTIHIVEIGHSLRVATRRDHPAVLDSIGGLPPSLRDRAADMAPSQSSSALVMGWTLHPVTPSTENLWPTTIITPSTDALEQSRP
jgi:hypothetical protein